MPTDSSSASMMLLTNANIITLDPLRPRAESLAIRDGLIQWVGDNLGRNAPGSDNIEVLDCKGKTVLPGFHDAHCHLRALAESLVCVDLGPSSCKSVSDLKEAINSLSRDIPPGAWIRGVGYHEFHLAEKRHPLRWDLDEVSPRNPVKLSHRSGHAHVLNSLALRHVGIAMETGDPPGGLIDRAIPSGEPTGLLFEMSDFLSRRIPPLGLAELERGIRLADRELLSLGITSIQDASRSNDLDRWAQVNSWRDKGVFRPNLRMIIGAGSLKNLENLRNSAHEKRRAPAGVKIILDETTGSLHPGRTELNELVSAINEAGYQAVIHATEMDAVSAACSAIEHALRKLPRKNHRHRIEHCSVCSPGLARRIGQLEIYVVTQPSFVHYNGDRYLATVPDESLRHLYPIGTLLKEGVRVAAGSDFPVAPPDPLVGIQAAASRKTDSGRYLGPSEAVTTLDALRMYTCRSAEAGFEESTKGTIAPGKAADLVVLNRDPLAVSSEGTRDITVEMTILGGEMVWKKPS